jgi:hypothetical protein
LCFQFNYSYFKASQDGSATTAFNGTDHATANVQAPDVNELIAKAFLFGFLKSAYPMMAPVSGLVKKIGIYMKSQGLQMNDTEIEAYVRSLDGELKFHNNGVSYMQFGLN